ncbi:hypothetical protein P8452_15873 [Trifolium repens]|nr:hypothetical protein P8452_15873 [Trifolium repens]
MEEEDGDVRVPMEWEFDGGVKVLDLVEEKNGDVRVPMDLVEEKNGGAKVLDLVEEKNGDVRVPVEEFKLRFLVTVVSSVGGSDEAKSFGSSASLLGAIPS